MILPLNFHSFAQSPLETLQWTQTKMISVNSIVWSTYCSLHLLGQISRLDQTRVTIKAQSLYPDSLWMYNFIGFYSVKFIVRIFDCEYHVWSSTEPDCSSREIDWILKIPSCNRPLLMPLSSRSSICRMSSESEPVIALITDHLSLIGIHRSLIRYDPSRCPVDIVLRLNS